MTQTAEFAPAKINLALHVRARRPDGYHDLETLFVFAADVGDWLHYEGEADGFELAIDGPFAGTLAAEPDNIVLRAARALAQAAGGQSGAKLRLVKNLPIASGIGGGSSDAAAALRLLNRLWTLGYTEDALADVGTALGADVPACVYARPMRGEGRGERLLPVAFAGAEAVLVNPGVAVATGPVFERWDGQDRGGLTDGDAFSAARAGRNDLTSGAMMLQPVIGEVLDILAAQPGAGLVRMSGSGATCFALFADRPSAEHAANAIRSAFPNWWAEPARLAGSKDAATPAVTPKWSQFSPLQAPGEQGTVTP